MNINKTKDIDWKNVKRVFVGALRECGPCHSRQFIALIKPIVDEALKHCFTIIVACGSAEKDAEIKKAEEYMKQANSPGFPYVRVIYKNGKAETYFGIGAKKV